MSAAVRRLRRDRRNGIRTSSSKFSSFLTQAAILELQFLHLTGEAPHLILHLVEPQDEIGHVLAPCPWQVPAG